MIVENAYVLAEQRYGWTKFEILSMVALPVVLVTFVLLTSSKASGWALPALGLLGSAILFFLGRHRKRASALTLVDDDGVWRLLRGDDSGTTRGTFVTFDNVNDVCVTLDKFDRPELMLTQRTENGDAAETLRIPVRLLDASAFLREELRPLVAHSSTGRDRERAEALLAD